MAAFRLLLTCCVLLVFPMSSDSLPEPGKLKMEFSTNGDYRAFSKALYKDAKISVKGQCRHTLKQTPKLVIKWKLKYTQCADIFMAIQESSLPVIWNQFRKYEIHGEDKVICNSPIHLTDQSSQKEYIPPNTNSTLADAAKSMMADEESGNKKRNEPNKEKEADGKKDAKAGEGNNDDDAAQEKDVHKSASQTKKAKETKKGKEKRSAELKDEKFKTLLRVKRDEPKAVDDSNEIPDKSLPKKSNNQQKKQPVEETKSQKNKEEVVPDAPKEVQGEPKSQDKANDKVPQNPMTNKGSSRIAVTKRDGIYILIMTVDYDGDPDTFHLDLDVSMESKSGYLSATDWPLLPFYGIMSLVYLFYGIVWLIVSACQWRDLLRIQFWIGGVIALGMLEKAVFYSEYNNINNTGITTPSLVVFAEIVSVAKRTLARMLVIIVSMGFGIVKPRLGKSLHRVLGVGALYFILGIVEGCLRSLSLKADPSKEQLIAGIPLAVLDAAICWWIFMSLVQTTRTLRIRRNVIKLSLYRHFTNTLIFAVLASVAYMIWSIKTHKFAECLKDWSELWLDEAFWHFLFSIILLVIMVLWRPTANNQRYAFTPIVDFDDDEEDNVTLSEAFDGMKMRNTRTEVIVNGDSKHKAEDDLKWVEENIPSSAADTVLPSVLDSDEELMTTKFEMSKME